MAERGNKPSTQFIRGWRDTMRYHSFLSRLDEQSAGEERLSDLAEIITPERPLVYWSMELYDDEENGIKGGGGVTLFVAITGLPHSYIEAPINRPCVSKKAITLY